MNTEVKNVLAAKSNSQRGLISAPGERIAESVATGRARRAMVGSNML